MASISTVCEICGKPARLTSVSNNQTVAQLEEGPQVHQPGTEGDEDCYVTWQQREAHAQVEAAKAQLEAARALVAAAEEAEYEAGAGETTEPEAEPAPETEAPVAEEAVPAETGGWAPSNVNSEPTEGE